MAPIAVSVYTAEENGGDFEFLIPGDKRCDYTLSYGDDGSVFYDQKLRKMRLRSDLGPPKVNSLQIYPVLKGGGFLVGKTRKKTRQRLILQKPDSGFRDGDGDDDDDDSGFDESYTWIRHAIISHYLGHCLKSIAIPVVQHIRGYSVSYSKTPNLKVSKKGITPAINTTFGISAMEVFSVVINNNNNQGGCVSLYGTIAISMYDDGYNSDYIYKRKRDDSESIPFSPSGDTTAASLTLTGPSRLIYACDSLWIFLDLMVKKDTGHDDVFYKGKMYWSYFSSVIGTYDEDEEFTSEILFEHPDYAYGKRFATILKGRSGGSVTINHLMLAESLRANVEVTLLNMYGGGGDGAAAAHVYGLIQARSSCDEGFTDWSVLVQKKKENDEYIGVRPGQLIPLSRSLVAVNACTSLKVSVELYERLRDTDLSQDDDEIVVKGIVDFPAQIYGTSKENISGCYGEIQVKVTWRAA